MLYRVVLCCEVLCCEVLCITVIITATVRFVYNIKEEGKIHFHPILIY